MGRFVPSLVLCEPAISAPEQIINVGPKTLKALKEYRMALKCTPDEFRRRHPNADATFMALAAATSINTIYHWGAYYGCRTRQPRPPQLSHLFLLGEASRFISSIALR